MQWTMEEVARALGVGMPPGLDPLARLAGVSIDSRTVRPGELFIAIHGPRHDGHAHVPAALAAGALAAVVGQDRLGGYAEEIRGRLYGVKEPFAALQRLGSAILAAWREAGPGRRVVAVAGSVGKTTTKEILAALLGARFRVLKTQGNLNNEYGLPLTLARLEDDDGVAVLELGMSHPGELAGLTRLCAPDAGVITRVAVEHLEFFSSVEEIAEAERELIENLPGKDAVAVLNADDERVADFAEAAPGRILWFGTGKKAEFRAEAIEGRGVEGTAFDFVSPQERTRLELRLAGRHNVMNALAALAAASEWGIGAAEAKRVFPSLAPAAMRGEVIRFSEGFTVINDSYNSSPAALQAMAELMAATPGYSRKILASGEMLELGRSAPALHRDAGRQAAQTGKIDWIFGVAGYARDFVAGAVEAGHPREKTQFFESSADAGEFLSGFVTRGDLVLLKGSRGVKMERALEAIAARHPRTEDQAGAPVKGRD